MLMDVLAAFRVPPGRQGFPGIFRVALPQGFFREGARASGTGVLACGSHLPSSLKPTPEPPKGENVPKSTGLANQVRAGLGLT